MSEAMTVEQALRNLILKSIRLGHWAGHDQTVEGCYNEEWADEQVDEWMAESGLVEPARAALPRWIPVEERLPEPHTVVALMNEDRFMNGPDDMDFRWHGVGYLDEFGEKYWSVIGERAMTLDAATHWMPLPAPPTQEEQE